jgi:hypothetical protein
MPNNIGLTATKVMCSLGARLGLVSPRQCSRSQKAACPGAFIAFPGSSTITYSGLESRHRCDDMDTVQQPFVPPIGIQCD